jgi:hypothetical protein
LLYILYKIVSCTKIDQYCDKCDKSQCFSCDYPFELLGNKCTSYGVVEFSSSLYSAIETQNNISITINRYYGAYGIIKIYYEIINNHLNKISNSEELLIFQPNEQVKIITLSIFRDYTLDTNTNQVLINLYNIEGGGYLGKIKSCTIEIFEDDSLFDNQLSTSSVDNITPVNGLYTISANNVNLSAYSFAANGNKRINLNDLFLYNLSDYKTNIFNYKIDNQYTALISNITYKQFIQIYTCSSNFFKLTYYDSASFDIVPLFTRVVNNIDIEEYCKVYLTR